MHKSLVSSPGTKKAREIKSLLGWARGELVYACERPLFEAEILLAYHLGQERIYLKMHDRAIVEDVAGFEALVARRAAHEPMEYITNSVSFYDIDLYIARGALIPRPETEMLIDKASAWIEEHGVETIAEIGVGSGAISVVLARKFPKLKIIASDISQEALVIAKQNIKTFELEGQIELRHTSLLDGIDADIEMIVSNPPYIAKHTPLAPNVAEYEPHLALYSQESGDELLKEIIILSKERGVKCLVCEMGYDQKQAIAKFVADISAGEVEFYKDLAGLDRGFIMQPVSSGT